LELEDEGLYTCVAENEVGRTRCSARLVVLEKDDPSQADRQPPVFLQELPAELVGQMEIHWTCTCGWKVGGTFSHSVYFVSPNVLEFC
jgi:hypothetical protein